MTAHRFFTDPSDITAGVVVLRGNEAHHAARSLRVRAGEVISVADGTGRVVTAEVRAVGETVEAEIRDERVEDLPRPAIALCQAVAKLDKLEIAVEKATEVGVQRIVPFVAERSIVRWDERKRERVRERLRAVALAAAKQSRSAAVPSVEAVVDGLPPVEAPCLVLHERAPTRLREALPDGPPQTLSLVVGPEGGLTDAEVDGLCAAGGRAVSLGERILRTETAGYVAAAIVGFRYGWIG